LKVNGQVGGDGLILIKIEAGWGLWGDYFTDRGGGTLSGHRTPGQGFMGMARHD